MDVWNNEQSVDPLELFASWLQEAERSEPNDANAAALATATSAGQPSVRMVLVKRADERGFCFFTNAESRKGRELKTNPRAALCFYWKTLGRQVRVEGRLTEMEAADVDAYFHSRSRNSQIAPPSRNRASRWQAVKSWKQASSNLRNSIRERCRGLRIGAASACKPSGIEFWVHGADRLHDRFLFTRDSGAWNRTRLYREH